jgi:hypothetical protein
MADEAYPPDLCEHAGPWSHGETGDDASSDAMDRSATDDLPEPIDFESSMVSQAPANHDEHEQIQSPQ